MAKRRVRLGLAVAIGSLSVIVVVAIGRAQPDCRADCTAALQQCHRDCEKAEKQERCMSNCQQFYEQCIAVCR